LEEEKKLKGWCDFFKELCANRGKKREKKGEKEKQICAKPDQTTIHALTRKEKDTKTNQII